MPKDNIITFTKKQKKLLLTVVQYIGLIASFWILYIMIDISKFTKIFHTLPINLLLVGLVISFARLWLMMERWILLSPKEAELTKWDYFKILLASGSVNLFIPGVVGADIVRSILVSKKAKKATSSAFLSVYLDRIIGLSSILILGIFATVLTPSIQNSFAIVLLLILMLMILVGIVWMSRNRNIYIFLNKILSKMGAFGLLVMKQLDDVLNALQQYKPSTKNIVYAFFLCFPIHMSWFAMVWLVGYVIGADVSFFAVMLITTIVWIITMIPLSIAGIGVRELSFLYLMGTQGVNNEQSVIMALFQSIIIILTGIIGLPLLFRNKNE